MNNHCKHGFIQDQCGVCRDLPLYQEKPPYDPFTHKYKEDEKPMTEDKKFFNSKGKQLNLCIICKNEPRLARGLGSKCYHLWRAGEIDHPELGKFVKTEKGRKMVESKNQKQKKFSIEPQDGFEVDKAKDDPYLKKLRSSLQDVKVLCQAIEMTTGNADNVKQEIQFFLKNWI